MSNPIQEIQKQTYRYYYQDGLVELAVGILFLVIGLDTYLISSLSPGSPSAIAAWIALPILTVAGIFGVQRFVKSFKERHVHHRTGYIEYVPKRNPYRWVITGGGLALILAVILLPYDWVQKGSVAGGTLLFIILASIGIQVDLKRLIVIGGLSLIIGVGFALSSLSDNASLAATIAAAGLILILTGSFSFRKYLNENPLPEEALHG
jgi:uncharacterized membrane protein